MSNFFYFILCGFIFSCFLNIIYFSKKHVKTGETKIFSILLIVNLISLASELACSYIGYTFLENTIYTHVMTKIYLILLEVIMLAMYTTMLQIKYYLVEMILENTLLEKIKTGIIFNISRGIGIAPIPPYYF